VKSSLLQVNVYVTHNLLNVLVQIANKMGFKQNRGGEGSGGANKRVDLDSDSNKGARRD
jgi:hypothetical protein